MKQENYFSEAVNHPPPRPMPVTVCDCGCGYEFQPNRKDQIYLNKQHADFAYNHGERKKRQVNQLKVEKILRLNDKVLKKFFQFNTKEGITCHLNNLKADGFRSEYYVGQKKIDSLTIYFCYNYSYFIEDKDGQKLIIIKKL